MSRRLGRQQKRKMRAALAERDAIIKKLGFLINEKIGAIVSLRHEIAEKDFHLNSVAAVLGYQFSALKPADYAADPELLKHADVINGIKPTLLDMNTAAAACVPPNPCLIQETVAVLQLLKYSQFMDRLSGNIHAYFSVDGKRVAYGLTRQDLREYPRDYLIERMVQAMALLMVDQFQTKPGGNNEH